ncbi:MAG: Mur ligase family protein [Bacilli bacterium]
MTTIFEIIIECILLLASFVIVFKECSCFVAEYYDFKRYYLLLKKRIINIFKNRNFLCILFVNFILIVTYIFIPIIYIKLILSIELLMYALIYKFNKRKITRRFLILLLLNIVFELTSIIFYKYYWLMFVFINISFLFVVPLCNMLLIPLESIIQQIYIRKAKNKIALCTNLRIIAITGSYGKTSTKLFIYSLLKQEYLVKCPLYANTLMGICSYINKNLTPYDEILLLEFGVDKVNGMDKFISFVLPNVSIVTSIGDMHLSTFKTIENIKKEKIKLLYAAKDIGFYNKNDDILNQSLKNNKHFKGYSEDDINIVKVDEEGILLNYNDKIIKTNLFGKHNFSNLACCIMVARYFGLKNESIIKGLKNLIKPEHRLQKIRLGNINILDDSYNGNIYGMKEAVNTLNLFKGKSCIITPGVVEQGKNYKNNNFNLGEYISSIDTILLVGMDKNHPLYQGIKNKRIDLAKVYFFKKFKDAFLFAKLKKFDNILIANDKENLSIN